MRKLTLIAALFAATFAVAAPASADDGGRDFFGQRHGHHFSDRHGHHFGDRRGLALRAGPRMERPFFRHDDFAFRHHRRVLGAYDMRRVVHRYHPYWAIHYLTFDHGYYRAHVRGPRGNFFALILNPYSGAIVAQFALR